MWLRDPRCEEVVRDAWEQGLCSTMGHPLKNCISECHAQLTQWNKREFGHVGRQIKLLKTKLQMLEAFPENNMDDIRKVRLTLNSWLDTEEIMWKQRSRNRYLKEGDRNTSFFHTKASNRKQRNWIQGLEDDNGAWQEGLDDIEHVATQYFSSLFTSSRPGEMTELLNAVSPSVTEAMNHLLAQDFQASEITQAIKQMQPNTAPRPDGLPPLFYQRFWSFTSNCVIQAAVGFLNHGIIPPDFNDTYIVLIPKIPNPRKITDYRPISLCNVAYKIASKAVANRLKNVLSFIVSENQSAFTKGRFITDNVLVAFETMHHISQKKAGKVGEMALKLDMSKAYDRVEWRCLENIMGKMGVHHKMIEVIMRCISTVTYSICINGQT